MDEFSKPVVLVAVTKITKTETTKPTQISLVTNPTLNPKPIFEQEIFRKRDDVIIIDYSYNISVIGFSGPVEEKEKRKDHSDSIIDGIGKSSFCARFIKPHQVNLRQGSFLDG